jgi:DUF3054 family protein
MNIIILILGDLLAIAVVTFIGFATHGEAGLSFLPRIAAIYFPLSIAWFLLAPFMGLFQQETIANPKQLWRPALTALFAAPLAAVLRGLLLNAPVIPIFAIVLGATTALGMVIWRTVYFLFGRNINRAKSV